MVFIKFLKVYPNCFPLTLNYHKFTSSIVSVTNFIWIYLYQYFIDFYGLNNTQKFLKIQSILMQSMFTKLSGN